METTATPTLQPAGFWIRLGALIIDVIIIEIVIVPILLTIYGSEYFTSTALIKGPADFFFSYALPIIYTISCWLLWRGTPGKLICGLRLVDAATGETLELWQAIVRYFGYIISAIPLFLGYIWVAFDARKQGFHDKLARSLVVRRQR